MVIRVHPRVTRRHPEVAEADAEQAFVGTLRKVLREDADPRQWVGVGLDGRGRLLEYVAIETGPDEWLIFHAMSATKKVLHEVGLRR